MVNRDYTKEVGLPSTQPRVPMPVALLILATLLLGVSAGVATMGKHRHVNAKAAVDPVAVQVFVRH